MLRFVLSSLLALMLLASVWTAVSTAAVPDQGDAGASRAAAEPAATWSDFTPTGWTNRLPLASGILAADSRGLNPATAAYRTSTNGGQEWTIWGTSNLAATPESSTSVRFVVDGLNFPDSADQNRIQFRIETLSGEAQTSDSYVIAVDTVAPGSPYGLQSYPEGWTNVNAFDERWINPTDLSGIAGVYYRLDREPVASTDGTFVATGNVLTDLQVPYEGKHTIYMWLVDGAGNVDYRTRNIDPDAFLYDATAPSVSVDLDGPLGTNGWYTGAVTAAFAPRDTLSGVAAWGWVLDGAVHGNSLTTSITGDMVHTLVVTATDVASNAAEPATWTIPLDATPPTLSYTVDGQPVPSGWYTAPVTVTFSLSDAVSGPDQTTWQLDAQAPAVDGQVVIDTDGDHTLTAYGADQAGNRSLQVALSLPLDRQPPATTLTLTPGIAPSGYYTAPVTAKLTATDQTSNVDVTWLRINQGDWLARSSATFARDDLYVLDYYSVDVAGNVEISRSQAITLDATPPAAPIGAAIEPDGWSANNSFALRWQNPADFSGIAGAYLYLGATPPRAGDGVFYPAANPEAPFGEIFGLTAPNEGEWPVWLWLVDGAGNAKPAAAVQVGALRHDATPPALDLVAAGPQGNAGWFTGPVDVTLTITDAGSGPNFLRYRLDGSPWQQSNTARVSLNLTTDGKHVLDYYGEDMAGAIGGPLQRTFRLDSQAPRPPLAVVIEPEGWNNTDQFTVTWRNPLDTSGVTTAYFGLTPPEHDRDGQAVTASSLAHTLRAPAEGSYDLHVWLEDAAGNASLGQQAHLTAALRYDATPPVTELRFSSQPNAAGWFRNGVGVSFATLDDLSGVAATVWQLDGQPPSTQNWLFVDGDGTHTLTVYSVDQAGNAEAPVQHVIRIDTQAPVANLSPLPAYSAQPIFGVRWSGRDDLPAETFGVKSYEPGSSGIAAYNVQVRRGLDGPWEPWLNETDVTDAVFAGQRGQTLAFRVQAIDAAGNFSVWSPVNGRQHIFVDAVENGYFATTNFTGWDTRTEIGMSMVQDDELFSGVPVPVGRLGWQGWESCSDPGDLPTLQCHDTWSSIAQTIQVPSLAELPKPELSIWYRVRSYDVITTSISSIVQLCDPQASFLWVDTFDVTVQPAGAATPRLLLREGNRIRPDFSTPNPPIPLRDLGWQLAVFDMRPYAGQTVRIELSNHNRIDGRFNTWTDVYAIRLSGERRKVFLPFAASANGRPPTEPAVCYPEGAPSGANPWMSPLLAPASPESTEAASR